jgi:hypothetical protein
MAAKRAQLKTAIEYLRTAAHQFDQAITEARLAYEYQSSTYTFGTLNTCLATKKRVEEQIIEMRERANAQRAERRWRRAERKARRENIKEAAE